jgi:putative glycosyltransferase (TIGR04348 family)
MTVSGEPPLSYESENRITPRRIGIATPAPPGSRRGNRVTAERWATLLRGLGNDVEVIERYGDEPFDLLIILHAGRGAASVRRFRELYPSRLLVVAVTGTDIYTDAFDAAEVARTLATADRVVVLQPRTAEDLPAAVRPKVRVIVQSAEPPARREPPRLDAFEIAVVGHLRPVKDPFRAAEASRLLGPESKVRIVHLGEAMTPDMRERARGEAATNPRYEWLGDLPHDDALAVMARCRLVALTSLSEGGPAVIPEAIVAGVPVIASRVAGCVGMLGDNYPGLFPPGDTPALARLFCRAEREPGFYEALRAACDHLRPRFETAAERAAWAALLAELGVGRAPARA